MSIGINNNLQSPTYQSAVHKNKVGGMGFSERMMALNNVVDNVSGLSSRETEILNQIRDKVSSTLGIPVKFNLGKTSDCGLTISVLGFNGTFADGARSTFLITKNMLTEMAEDENKYREWMSWVNNQI